MKTYYLVRMSKRIGRGFGKGTLRKKKGKA